MLGYSDGFVTSSLSGNGTIWLDNVACRGSETDIADCPHSSWGRHDCSHSEDVAVRCVGRLATTTAQPTAGEKSVATIVCMISGDRFWKNL